jgi:hypothetical protein
LRLEVRDDSWAPAVSDRGGGGERLRRASGGIGPKGQLGRGDGCCASWAGAASWAAACWASVREEQAAVTADAGLTRGDGLKREGKG